MHAFHAIKDFFQGKYDKLRSEGTVCGMLVHSEWDKSSPKMTLGDDFAGDAALIHCEIDSI